MKAYYASKISENMAKTQEGFLLCMNVPISRTGWYEYLGEEIGLNEKQGEIIKVYRSPESVFSKQSIASFEGKPVTDDHPPNLLTPKDAMLFTKGTVQNVRQSDDEPDLLVADLMVYDFNLINEIEQGKREVSCGYDLVYKDNGDGTYSQEQICGNHVAIVNAGRAGNRVSIKDSKIKSMKGEKKYMRKKRASKGTNFLAALGLKQFAADAEPEEIAGMVDEMNIEKQNKDNDEVEKEEASPSNDEEPNSQIAALSQQIAKLTEIVNKLVQPKEKTPEEEIDEAIESLSNNTQDEDLTDEENSVTVPVQEISEDEVLPNGVEQSSEELPKNPLPSKDSASMIMALKAVRPVIANIKNPTEKKKACDSLMKAFKSTKGMTKNQNGYAEILKTQRSNAVSRQKAIDAKQKADEKIGENLKKKFNPHYKEVK